MEYKDEASATKGLGMDGAYLDNEAKEDAPEEKLGVIRVSRCHVEYCLADSSHPPS